MYGVVPPKGDYGTGLRFLEDYGKFLILQIDCIPEGSVSAGRQAQTTTGVKNREAEKPPHRAKAALILQSLRYA